MNSNQNETTGDGTAMAAGIIRTVQHVLRETAENRDALPSGTAGSMGVKLCVAIDLLPGSERGAVKTSLGDVAHILNAAFQEKTAVSPTIAAALADIIRHATEAGADRCGTVDEYGRQYVATIQPPPSVTAAGIVSIELYTETPIPPEEMAARRVEAVNAARRGVAMMEERNRLKKETDSLLDIVAKGGLKDDTVKKQVVQRLVGLLERVGSLKTDVDTLPGGGAAGLKAEVEALKKERDAMAAEKGLRVPDWRDTQRVPGRGVLRDATGAIVEVLGKPVGAKEDGASTAEAVSGSARQVQAPAPTQSARSASGQEKPQDKPAKYGMLREEEVSAALKAKPAAKPEAKKEAKPEAKPAPKKAGISGPCSREAEHKNGTARGGTAEISGYFTPEEAAKLTARIREWLSQCKCDHRLGDLMTSIEEVFHLSDGQLGELVGISSRLVCNVRHGRPSPFSQARFTEVFGFDGGVK